MSGGQRDLGTETGTVTGTGAPRAWAGVVVLSVSLLMIGLDNTILNVALPTLQRSLDASTSQLQWIVDAYMLVFAGLLLTAGNLGDRVGRRRVLQAGLVVFGAGSALAAAATTPAQLIGCRAFMGIGGALIMPSTLSIITNMFGGEQRARAIAVWTAVAGIGVALGPVTGGWLLQRFWWGSIFLVNVPISVLALLAGRRLVPESRDPMAGRADLGGVTLSVAGLLSLVYGIIEAPTNGWTGPRTLGAFAAAATILTVFIGWEIRSSHPMLQLRLFRDRRFTAASVTISLAFLALFGVLFVMTQFLQLVLGYSAFEAGLRTLPVAAALILGSALSTPATTRLGSTITVTAGMILAGAGLVVAAAATTTRDYSPVLTTLLLCGLGIGLAMAPATDSVMGSLPLEKAGVGSAMNDTARLVGGAFGVAVLGTVVSQVYRMRIDGTANLLPEPIRGAVHESLQAALHVAQQLNPSDQAALTAAARGAFTHAMQTAALVGAGATLAAALVALLRLPSRPSSGHRGGSTQQPRSHRRRHAAAVGTASRQPRSIRLQAPGSVQVGRHRRHLGRTGSSPNP